VSDYIELKGSPARRLGMERSWRWHCLQRDIPYLSLSRYKLRGDLELELRGRWWLSEMLWNELKRCYENASCRGNCVSLSVPPRVLKFTADQLLALVRQYRPPPQERFSRPAALARGLARCLWAKGFEDILQEGAEYFIREIPNMPGHVVVLGAGVPLVGIHLERFELG